MSAGFTRYSATNNYLNDQETQGVSNPDFYDKVVANTQTHTHTQHTHARAQIYIEC